LSLIRKASKVCRSEGGIFILVSNYDEVVDAIDAEKIPDLIILPTLDEAIDAAFMNELENDFKEEDDDELDLEDGFSIENEK
jgi:anti-sigma B factor antagonist